MPNLITPPFEPPTHYPGPWEVYTSDEGRVWVQETATPERLVVCDIPGDMETIEGAELCNADLIAAAPRLLAALEKALRDSGCDGGLCCHEWHEEARAAIAAAREGATP